MGMYDIVEKAKVLYDALQDELSRDIFWARLALDISPCLANAVRVDSYCDGLEQKRVLALGEQMSQRLKQLNREGKKVILHGTGATGQRMASYIRAGGGDFYAFCSRSGSHYPNGLMGKPAFPTEWLYEHAQDKDIYVLFVHNSYDEVLPQLLEHHFPESHLLSYVDALKARNVTPQYFAFPELYPGKGAFIDGGCFDAADSIHFASWSKLANKKSSEKSAEYQVEK